MMKKALLIAALMSTSDAMRMGAEHKTDPGVGTNAGPKITEWKDFDLEAKDDFPINMDSNFNRRTSGELMKKYINLNEKILDDVEKENKRVADLDAFLKKHGKTLNLDRYRSQLHKNLDHAMNVGHTDKDLSTEELQAAKEKYVQDMTTLKGLKATYKREKTVDNLKKIIEHLQAQLKEDHINNKEMKKERDAARAELKTVINDDESNMMFYFLLVTFIIAAAAGGFFYLRK